MEGSIADGCEYVGLEGIYSEPLGVILICIWGQQILSEIDRRVASLEG